MKARWMGLLLLAVVALGAVGYMWFSSAAQVTEITGYVGGEKISLLEDEQVQKILKDKYHLSLDYSRAGSIEMVTSLDRTGKTSCFPPTKRHWCCSKRQTALQKRVRLSLIRLLCCTPTPPWRRRCWPRAFFPKAVGVFSADMEKLTALMESGVQWSDVGLPELYGSVAVNTTDPTKSNSGNMFAGCWPTPCAAAR